jgi:hypothetical protein
VTTEPQVALNPMIQAYWASFIRGQDPNKFKLSSAPEWNHFDSVGLGRIHFVDDPSNVTMEVVPTDQLTRCNYLTTIGGSLGQ